MKLRLQLVILLFILCFATTAWAQLGGSLDTTFNHTGIVYNTIANDTLNAADAIAIQNDGKIVVAGSTAKRPISGFQAAVVRYNTNGNLDTSFNHTGYTIMNFGSNSASHFVSVVIQTNGKIVALGLYNYNYILVRFNSNGTIDSTFGSNGIALSSIVGGAYSVVLQPDGKIISGGFIYNKSGQPAVAIIRCDTSGNLDAAFGDDGITSTTLIGNEMNNFELDNIELESDGKIVAAGWYEYELGYYQRYMLLRYNANGSPDSTFAYIGVDTVPVNNYFAYLFSITLQADNKIVAAAANDSNAHVVVRFNPDGSLDSTFNSTGISNSLNITDAETVLLQSDGKIIVGGNNNGFGLARLNTDGIIDTSFGNEGYVSATIIPNTSDAEAAIALQSDGKIVAAGYARDSIYVDGNYFALARYNDNIVTSVPIIQASTSPVFIYPNPTTGQFTIRSTGNQNGYTVEVYNEIGQIVLTLPSLLTGGGQEDRIDLSAQPAGLYTVKLKSNEGAQVGKVLLTK